MFCFLLIALSTSRISVGCHGRCHTFPEVVGIPFVSRLPWSWGTTPVVGFCTRRGSGHVSSGCCHFVTGGYQECCAIRGVSVSSTGLYLYHILLQRYAHGKVRSWFFSFISILAMAVTRPRLCLYACISCEWLCLSARKITVSSSHTRPILTTNRFCSNGSHLFR